MEPLRGELGKIRNETNAIKEKGVGLCSSVKELDNWVRSFLYFTLQRSLLEIVFFIIHRIDFDFACFTNMYSGGLDCCENFTL